MNEEKGENHESKTGRGHRPAAGDGFVAGWLREKQLEGIWYLEGWSGPAFTFYDDGSCKIQGEYGTGTWTLVNDDQLKISNFYGETVVLTIESIKDGCLTVTNELGNTGYFWRTPHDE